MHYILQLMHYILQLMHYILSRLVALIKPNSIAIKLLSAIQSESSAFLVSLLFVAVQKIDPYSLFKFLIFDFYMLFVVSIRLGWR